ncbi:ADP-ribose glycohydrolase MACROD2 [Rhinoderma darwinii]|uniref:ADP-ribose glycohydrolase MACROD2 n=1 Tax=Rhinoderma darwinii TaxID=43563 RepID=UPI003F663CB9
MRTLHSALSALPSVTGPISRPIGECREWPGGGRAGRAGGCKGRDPLVSEPGRISCIYIAVVSFCVLSPIGIREGNIKRVLLVPPLLSAFHSSIVSHTLFPVSLGNSQLKSNTQQQQHSSRSSSSSMYPSSSSSSSSSKKKRIWREEKDRLLSMSQAERRKELCRDYIPLDNIPSLLEDLRKTACDDENREISSLCDKVSLYKGDITQLEVDAIVNAANSSLLGGGGVDGCIHRASGTFLSAECRTLGGCATGQAKITCGYELPAKYVIHTVGPIARGQLNDSHKEDLANCYKTSLALVKEKNLRSIAFPCISTGIYGFPNEPAAIIALTTAKEWLKKNREEVDRIIFCVFLEVDYKIYRKKLAEFFLKDGDDDDDADKEERNLVSKKLSEDFKGTDKNAQSPPTKKCKAKKTDMQEKPDDAPGDKKELPQEAENAEDLKEITVDSDTQEMKESGSISDNESCVQTDDAEEFKADITGCNEDSEQTEAVLHTNADVDMAEASQDQELSMDKENRNEDKMNIEPQVQSGDISKKTLSTPLENEANEPNHESHGTIPITDTCIQPESEEISEDVQMLSQTIDRSHDDDEENNTAVPQK